MSGEIRGKGSLKRIIHDLNNLPEGFIGDLQCNGVVTKINEICFEELINVLKKETPIRRINLTFYVPKKKDAS